MCPRHCPGHFICLVSLIFTLTYAEAIVISMLHMRKVPLVKQSNWPKNTQLGSGRAGSKSMQWDSIESALSHYNVLPPWEPWTGWQANWIRSVALQSFHSTWERRCSHCGLRMAKHFSPEFYKLPAFFSEFNLNTCLRINRLFECLHNVWYFNCRFWT